MVRVLLILSVLSSACAQKAPSFLVANPPSVDFDTLSQVARSTPFPIEFTNIGKTPSPNIHLDATGDVGQVFSIQGIPICTRLTLLGAPCDGAFNVVQNDCEGTMLAPGDSCSIYVTLDYTATGSFAGTLNMSGTEVPLHGTVASPQIAIAALTETQQSVYQGDWPGPTPGPWRFSITNVSGGTTGPFTVSTTDPFSASGCDMGVEYGQSCELDVSYLHQVPLDTVPGDQLGTIAVHAAIGGDVSANFTLRVQQSGTFQLSDAAFGSIGVNMPVSHIVTVMNPGRETAEGLKVSFIDDSASSAEPNPIFLADDNCSNFSAGTLNAGGSCTLRLVANVASAIQYTGRLTVTADNTHPATAPVTATGTR